MDIKTQVAAITDLSADKAEQMMYVYLVHKRLRPNNTDDNVMAVFKAYKKDCILKLSYLQIARKHYKALVRQINAEKISDSLYQELSVLVRLKALDSIL